MTYKTKQRTLLYELLKSRPHERFSVKDIAAALSDSNISVSAIYRNLSAMADEGLVQRSIKNTSQEALYQFMDCDTCRDELHLTCTTCGKVIHMDHSIADSMQDRIKQADGFRIDRNKTILYGTCKTCSTATGERR